MRAICPGSFDPVTRGHLDIIRRADRLFDEVVVAVGRNSTKNYLFTPEQRVEMLELACQGTSARVTVFEGLLVDFCAANDIDVIVKGLRYASDFEFELQMAQMNHALTGIETAMLPTSSQYAHISATMVRQIASLGGDVTAFVPPGVTDLMDRFLAERDAR
jgi:pantetheine-phosphate adenylyltransferase